MKQQLIKWLFPPQEQFETEVEDIISNKKFIFMSVTCTAFIIIMRCLFSE